VPSPTWCRRYRVACSTAYRKRGCRCRDCTAWKAAANRRQRGTDQPPAEVVVRTRELGAAPRPAPVGPARPGLVRTFLPSRFAIPVKAAPLPRGAIEARSRPRQPLPALPPSKPVPTSRCSRCGAEWPVTSTVAPLGCPSCDAPAPARPGVRRGGLGTGITPGGDWSSIIRPRRLLGLSCGHVVAATARVGEAVSCAGCGDTIRVVARDLSERPAATGRPRRPGRLALTSGAAPAAAENARAGLAPKRASGWSDLTRPQGGLVKVLLAEERRRAG